MARIHSYSIPAAALFAAVVVNVPAQAEQPFNIFSPQIQAAPQMQLEQQVARPDADDENGELAPRLQRQVVDYAGREAPGTVIVDTPHTFLYYVLGNGKAIRYGIGVGREGFTWSGVKSVARKTEWPDWYPPPEMVARQPYLPRVIAGGPGNPLGARAMYIGGTEYRIHGTNDPSSIGKFMSSGCIRMTNDNAIDLYNRVQVGAKVIVLPMRGAPSPGLETQNWQARAQAAIEASRRTAPARMTWNARRTDGLY